MHRCTLRQGSPCYILEVFRIWTRFAFNGGGGVMDFLMQLKWYSTVHPSVM